ncbi:MAG TPA: DUF6516 family protein [Candidatus Lokiarchaeia archaeon]|nr:DUF6516 family protein [Candidatus Lokiarchaeia archaeon]
MSRVQKLQTALEIAKRELADQVLTQIYYAKLNRVQIMLNDGTNIFIQYNDHEEYSYSIAFSAVEGDLVRFDNYDDKWEVTTRPHHFHPRANAAVVQSPMTGNPEEDIPQLCELIKSGELLQP